MRSLQLAGVICTALGLIVLFVLRGPLYAFIVTALQLMGVFVGILLLVIGIAMIFGGSWMSRRRDRRWGSTALPIWLHET